MARAARDAKGESGAYVVFVVTGTSVTLAVTALEVCCDAIAVVVMTGVAVVVGSVVV
jgi:hypothetical protein